MARRALSPEEAAGLGLDVSAPKRRRALSPEETQALGLSVPVKQVTIPENTQPDDIDVSADFRKRTSTGNVYDASGASAVGLGAGFTQNFQDEGSAAVQMPHEVVRRAKEALGLSEPRTYPDDGLGGGQPSLMDVYRQKRELGRTTERIAEKEHFLPYHGSKITGDMMAQVPAAFLTMGASLTPGGQGAMGALSALGNTEAELTPDKATNGDVARASGEMLLTGGLSAGMTRLGQGASNYLAKRADKGISGAVAQQLGKETTKATDAVSSANGVANNIKAQAMKTWERLTATVADPTIPEHVKEAAKKSLTHPDMLKIRDEVMMNYAGDAPGLLGKYGAAKASAAAAEELTQPAAIAAATDAALENPIKTQVAPRVKDWVSKGIPIAVMGGAMSAGLPAWAAGGLGLGTAILAGRPGTKFANMVKSPSFRKMGWEGVSALQDHVAAPIASTVRSGIKNSELSPEVMDLLEQLLAKKEDK